MVMGGVVAKAQDDEEIKVRSIMVTANRVLQELFTLPMTVNVVTAEDLAREPYSTILDALKQVPGIIIDDSSAAVAGAGRVSVRGENTGRTLFLINGIKAVDKDGSAGTLMITPSQVERIEIIKGPASVLYGPEAIGGVINVITKKGGDKPVAFSQNFIFDTSIESVDIQTSIFGSYKGFNYRLSGSGINAHNRKVPKGSRDGDEAFESHYKNRNYTADIGYDWDNKSVSFRYDYYENSAYYSNGLSAVTNKTTMWLDPNDRETYSARFIAKNITEYLKNLAIQLSYQEITRTVTSDFNNAMMGPVMYMKGLARSKQKQYTSSLQTEWSLGTHYLTTGLEYEYDDIDVANDTYPYTVGRPIIYSNAKAKQSVLGIFAQDEWKITDYFKSTLGLRFTNVDMKFGGKEGPAYRVPDNERRKDSRLVGSLGLVFTGIENWALRAQFSQGYRYPTARQLFTGSAGHGGGSPAIFPNPDLQPETSNNYEVGARFMNNYWDFDLSFYYSQAKQLIQSITDSTDPSNPDKNTYINYNKAKTYGIELLVKYTFPDIGLSPYINGAWMRRKVFLRDGRSTNQTRNPPFEGRVGIKWDVDINENHHFYSDLHMDMASKTKSRVSESMTSTTIGNALTEYPAWQNVSLTIGVKGGENHKYNVSLSLRNIFDQHYFHSRGSAAMPEAGFHAVLGIGFEY
jgi:hemoglobin/transferrin/lactoferrin receptor protein